MRAGVERRQVYIRDHLAYSEDEAGPRVDGPRINRDLWNAYYILLLVRVRFDPVEGQVLTIKYCNL